MLNLSKIRQQFPALKETDAQGQPYAFFDGPGGTQVPHQVITAMNRYLTEANANHGGHFITSQRNDQLIETTRQAMADFLNASAAKEIVFGQNMTSLTFNLSRAMSRLFQPGDEIIVTNLDHDANISPWLALEEQGIIIKWVDFDVTDCRLDLTQLTDSLSEKTKLVAVGYASNAVGTINPIAKIVELVRQKSSAWVWVDAVHYAPHGPIDVQALGCDFLVCSAYKFFGPHIGVLWGRYDLLEQIPAYKVRPADDNPPGKFETGTQNHEGIAGTNATIAYLAELGRTYGQSFAPDPTCYPARRGELKQAMQTIMHHERELFTTLLNGLQTIPEVTIYGLTNSAEFAERCPTLAFTHAKFSPTEIAAYLGERGIFVWNGHYYAITVINRLGLAESGGAVRVGLAHYNTPDEIERLILAVREMAERGS
ncbi:cysteine desulfurase-like protein [Anaerolineales bacterium HSG24]|nr:cysteine desulfurase-like protein [Anaerolineales bacterium HSG24]